MNRALCIALAMFASTVLAQDKPASSESDKSTESLKLPTYYQGEQGGLPKRGFRILGKAEDYESFKKLMKSKGKGDELPESKEIDFSKQRVLVADYGTAESCKGIFPIALFRTKDEKVHVRYDFSSFQVRSTGEIAPPTYHSWSVMVVPLNEKGYVIETDHQRIKGEPEKWAADAELKP